MHDGNIEDAPSKDIGCRDLPQEPLTPDTTLRELICADFENTCFDTIYTGLAMLQRGESIPIRGIGMIHGTTSLMAAVRCTADLDAGMFAPGWLQRIRVLLDEIAKENGYEPPGHPGADASRPDPSHED